METKQCFTCKQELPLSEFDIDRKDYQVKADKGTCKVCKECEYKRAVEQMSTIKFNFGTNKFDIINFETVDEVNKFFKR
jgi:hypothetical protein